MRRTSRCLTCGLSWWFAPAAADFTMPTKGKNPALAPAPALMPWWKKNGDRNGALGKTVRGQDGANRVEHQGVRVLWVSQSEKSLQARLMVHANNMQEAEHRGVKTRLPRLEECFAGAGMEVYVAEFKSGAYPALTLAAAS